MKVLFYYFSGFLFLLILSCQDPTDVGSEIIPSDDALKIDSILFSDIILNTHRDDSILSSNLTNIRIGTYDSDIFGKSKASYYTEVYFGGGFPQLENAVFDSLVLYLSLSGFQGDSTVMQSFSVYEMTDTLKSFTETDPDFYYISETVSKGQLLGQFENVLYKADSTLVDTIETTAHLKTKVSHAFAEDLFHQLNDSTITNNAEFQQYLKGIVIEPTEGTGGDGWFEINTNTLFPKLTGFYFYYHNSEESANRAIGFPIVLDSTDEDGVYFPGAQNINPTANDYSEAENELKTQIDNYNWQGNNEAYLQGGNGSYVELDFSKLLNEFEPNTTINLAELTIKPILENLADTIDLPTGLILAEGLAKNSNGELTGGLYGIDGSGRVSTESSSNRFDRNSSAARVKNGEGDYQYTFFMPRTTQSIKDGLVDEPKLYLFVNNRTQSNNSFKFNKSNIDLKILYTKTD